MLALAGLTPPASVVKSHSPGLSSSLPPVKAVSWALGSGLWCTRSAACMACQSMAGRASSWFPSAPWNELPGSGLNDGGSGVALAAGAITKPKAKALASTASAPPEARRRVTASPVPDSTSEQR